MPRKASFAMRKKAVIDALENIKAKDIIAIDVKRLTTVCDMVVIATAESARQTKALARSVHDAIKELGGTIIGTEGEESGDWVLVDAADIVVHIMQPQTRSYYNLEELWGQGKVERISPPGRRLPTMEEPELPAGVVVRKVRAKPVDIDETEEIAEEPVKRRVVTRTAKQSLAQADNASAVARKAPAKKIVAKRATPKASAPVAKKAAKRPAAKVGAAGSLRRRAPKPTE